MPPEPRSEHQGDGPRTVLEIARDQGHPNRPAALDLVQDGVAYYQLHALLDADYCEGERRARDAAAAAAAAAADGTR